MPLQIKALDSGVYDAWDDYVRRTDDATFFHRAGWATVLQRAFGHRAHFLYAQQGGEIAGILPLAEVKSILFGHSLSSLPFCVYGGIVADTEEAAAALRKAACELADRLQVGALELRNCHPSDSGWPVKELYYTFRKTIEPDDDTNLKAIPNRQRAMIRKGIAEGLQSEWDTGIDRLYRVYSESVRNLGTPVFSASYLRILREVFAEDCSVLMITQSGRDVAGVMSFYFRDQVLPYYGGSTAQARTIKGVNHFMYWELLRRSCEQGFRVFDFGRSKASTGPFSFKKNFGFTPQPLPYEYYLVTASAVPDVNPLNPKYKLMVNAWTRLPLPLANLLGPPLARNLG
ncbi:FemAB family PEP-CTERM system-associated protein [Seongchinamella sediminis]|uniref:FemAB family PEP-CTERM system-associated protein n=1 Tax=Seongchinamella sediminis TaxID=2283635 RepID=A0A3L7DWY4_9GAMM|nr:FemAB family XrtA/PEP-CTERM system-associated protein [Seongchinamella sediminis]RLQ20753.1 FemAB family PEP-CTERM system-associated protein [Seongchinamella sediminis]